MPERPEVVCIRGSMRFVEGGMHLCRIDLADRVVVVNQGEHYGESTLRELAYAEAAGKPVTFVGRAYGQE